MGRLKFTVRKRHRSKQAAITRKSPKLSIPCPLSDLPIELIQRIIRFATVDYATARALLTVSKLFRTWIPPAFFRTSLHTMSFKDYFILNSRTSRIIEHAHLFLPNGSNPSRLQGNWSTMKHLSVSVPNKLYYSSLPTMTVQIKPDITHVILEAQEYDPELLRAEIFRTVTHFFLRINEGTLPDRNQYCTPLATRFFSFIPQNLPRLEVAVFSTTLRDMEEKHFRKFLDKMDMFSSLRVVGLYPYHIRQRRHAKLAQMNSRVRKITHQNLAKIVIMPPRDFRAHDWYSWQHVDGPLSVWCEAERLLGQTGS